MKEETRYALANQEKVNKRSGMMIGNKNVPLENLCPVPMVIVILGQLMTVAANQQDFPIDHQRDRFNLIKHPESFRTSLFQIGNQGYLAFEKAHSNMERICLLMQQVPAYVREVMKILESGNQVAVEKFLPLRLKRIQEAAKESLELSKKTADAFTQLSQLINQVIEATSLSQSLNEKAAREKEKSIKVEEEKQKMLKEELERKKKELERLERVERIETENRQRAFEAAIKQLSYVERFTFWIGGENNDTRRRAEANKLEFETSERVEKIKAEARQTEREIKKINDKILETLQKEQENNVRRFLAEKSTQLLRDGMPKLKELTELWFQLIIYFQTINNVIEQASSKRLEDLCADAKLALQHRTLVQLVVDSTLQSSQHSYLTYRIADMYVNLSGKYIMGNVARLGKMITASDNIEEAERELLDSCKEASDGITAMVLESKQKLIRDIDQRQTELALQFQGLT